MYFKAFALSLVAILALGPTQAGAFGLGGAGLSSVKRHLEPRFISSRGNTLAPMGHVIFCAKVPSQCRSFGSAVVKLDGAKRLQLVEVNRRVNSQIRPVNDKGASGSKWADIWSLSPNSGDCEDYALTKRAELIKKGWPSRALRLAVAKTRWGEGHAVLVVRTSEGDLVLDNRNGRVVPWHKAGLTWLKIQSSSNARHWQTI